MVHLCTVNILNADQLSTVLNLESVVKNSLTNPVIDVWKQMFWIKFLNVS